MLQIKSDLNFGNLLCCASFSQMKSMKVDDLEPEFNEIVQKQKLNLE